MNLGFDHGAPAGSVSPDIPGGLGKGATVTLGIGESLTVTAIVDVAPEVDIIDATEYSPLYDRESGASLRRGPLIKLTVLHDIDDPTQRRVIEMFQSGEIADWRLWLPGGQWFLFPAFVWSMRIEPPKDNYITTQFTLHPIGEFEIYG